MTRALKQIRSWREHPQLWLAVVAIYLAVIIARWVAASPTAVPAIWPSAAVLAVGLMTVPRDQRLKCALGAFAAGLAVSSANGFYLRPVVGCLEAAALAALTTAACGRRANFSDLRTLLTFLVFVVAPCALASGLALYILSWLEPFSWRQTINWMVSHALGAAIFIPAFSIILDARRYPRLNGSRAELAASLIVLALVGGVLLYAHDKAHAFVIFPMVMLIAFRHGPVGSAVASLVLAVLAVIALYAPGASAFGPGRLVEWTQGFVVVAFLTTLPAAGAVASYARTRTLLAERTATARAARRKADAAAVVKSEFLANMSHEIRTPLNGVIGLTDALSRTELTPPQREMVGMVLTSGKALTRLLSDALDLARADSGALHFTQEAFDIRQTVREAAYLFEAAANEKGLAFEVAFDLEWPAVVGDSLRIKQIVSNLISNAVKFTSQGGVRVETRYSEGRLTVEVRDTGPGFDAETQARLFNRFEQGDSSVTRRFGGSGLGLAIAHRLAQMMGGGLEADAVPGAGAVFTFTALLAPAQASSVPHHDEGGMIDFDDAARMRVLLAEDNYVNQRVVQAMIGALVDLTIVGDGQAAVDASAAQPFDVILMDTHMPVLDGLSAIRAIREREAGAGAPRVPVVSLTADAMPQQVAAAKAAGADFHVAKPITAESLIGALQACMLQPPAAPRLEAAS